MLDPITGLPIRPSTFRTTSPRMSDWAFLATLTRAAQARATTLHGNPMRYAVGLERTLTRPLDPPSPAHQPSVRAVSAPAKPAPGVIGRAFSVADDPKTSSPDPVPVPVPTPPPPVVVPIATPVPSDPSPVAIANGSPMRLEDYPRPSGDTGRGFHWVPTLKSDPSVVDRFVQDARSMGASWVTFLNDGSNVGQNDYLVRRLVDNHIEPVMRIYTSQGNQVSGDVAGMVRHYVGLGVHYFQPFNEPNLPQENPDGKVSVDGYVDRWITAARAIVDGGGLPGVGALAPAAPVDDVEFLRKTLRGIQQRGAGDLLNQSWLSVHNYTFNRPVDYQNDSNGFLKFRWYDQVAREELGRSVPVISTEGGPRLGASLDSHYPAVDESRRDQIATAAFNYLPGREPYFFAQTQWVLANEAGGGQDPAWRADALYDPSGAPTPLAVDLRNGVGQA